MALTGTEILRWPIRHSGQEKNAPGPGCTFGGLFDAIKLLCYYTIILLRVSALGLVHVTGAATVELVSNHRSTAGPGGNLPPCLFRMFLV